MKIGDKILYYNDIGTVVDIKDIERNNYCGNIVVDRLTYALVKIGNSNVSIFVEYFKEIEPHMWKFMPEWVRYRY